MVAVRFRSGHWLLMLVMVALLAACAETDGEDAAVDDRAEMIDEGPAVVAYRCDDGTRIQVAYDNSADPPTATVTLPDEREITLPQVPAASGARYQGEALGWWTKGGDGMLEQDEMPVRECHEDA